jgi:hypothetical protein
MPDAIREGHLSNFSRYTGPEAERRSQDALGKRQQVAFDRHRSQIASKAQRGVTTV